MISRGRRQRLGCETGALRSLDASVVSGFSRSSCGEYLGVVRAAGLAGIRNRFEAAIRHYAMSPSSHPVMLHKRIIDALMDVIVSGVVHTNTIMRYPPAHRTASKHHRRQPGAARLKSDMLIENRRTRM